MGVLSKKMHKGIEERDGIWESRRSEKGSKGGGDKERDRVKGEWVREREIWEERRGRERERQG